MYSILTRPYYAEDFGAIVSPGLTVTLNGGHAGGVVKKNVTLVTLTYSRNKVYLPRRIGILDSESVKLFFA